MVDMDEPDEARANVHKGGCAVSVHGSVLLGSRELIRTRQQHVPTLPVCYCQVFLVVGGTSDSPRKWRKEKRGTRTTLEKQLWFAFLVGFARVQHALCSSLPLGRTDNNSASST